MSLRTVRSTAMLPTEAQSSPKQQAGGSSRVLNTILGLIVVAALSYFTMSRTTTAKLDTVVRKVDVIRTYNHSLSSSKLTFWSSDFHISPIADIKHQLKDYGVTVIDKSLSGHCHLTDTCERDLRVITKLNGIHLRPCANQLRREFYNSYKADPVMQSVDAFVCTHAASMCELFMPFQKPMIVIASTRYEIGRLDEASWRRWNRNLQAIAASPYNTIAANNVYDQEYIRYFTGIKDVVLLPNVCNYVHARYAPTRPEILLGPARGVHPTLQEEMFGALAAYKRAYPSSAVVISPIRDLYPHFQYSDLAAHPAMVILPYQVSFMSLFEFYRMQIPLFAPSPALLTRWHLELQMLNERTWMSVLGQPQRSSILPRHPIWSLNSSAPHSVPASDPNNEFDGAAVLEWLSLSDFYDWPHIQTFDSWNDLFGLLTDPGDRDLLKRMSVEMGEFNVLEEARIKQDWMRILDKVRTHKERRQEASSAAAASARGEKMYSSHVPDSGFGISSSPLPDDIDVSLQQAYGYKLSVTDCGAQIEARLSQSSAASLRSGAKPQW